MKLAHLIYLPLIPFMNHSLAMAKGACVMQWSHEPCHAGPPRMDESYWRVLSDRGSLKEEMTSHSSILAARTPWAVQKGKKRIRLKDEPPGQKVFIVLLEESRRNLLILIVPEKNGVAGPKQKWYSFVDVYGGERQVQSCKQQYFIGTWNDRFMHQDKLDVVKQEMTRLSIDVFGISELKWRGMEQS